MISKEIPMLRKFVKEPDQDILMMHGPPWLFLDSVTAPKGEVQRVDKAGRYFFHDFLGTCFI